MGNWDVSKPNKDGEPRAELATKTCNKQIASKLEDAELARDSEETCNNKQVSCKLVASEDCISRADAEALFRNARGELHKSAIRNEQNGHPIKDLHTRDLMLLNAEQMIHLLPSVTPKQRTGHWIETAAEYYKAVNEYGGGVDENTPYFTDNIGCSVCLAMFSTIDNETERFNYCPHCGVKMVEPQERSDDE